MPTYSGGGRQAHIMLQDARLRKYGAEGVLILEEVKEEGEDRLLYR